MCESLSEPEPTTELHRLSVLLSDGALMVRTEAQPSAQLEKLCHHRTASIVTDSENQCANCCSAAVKLVSLIFKQPLFWSFSQIVTEPAKAGKIHEICSLIKEKRCFLVTLISFVGGDDLGILPSRPVRGSG